MKMQEVPLYGELSTRPTLEPVSITEARKQLELQQDPSHDEHLLRLITQAREQFEHDTESAMCYQTWVYKTAKIYDGLRIPKRPVHSITTIKYYDSGNALQTLSSTVYQLDKPGRMIRLAYDKDWPDTVSRWDAYELTIKFGYSQDGALVPQVAKQAMLLLIGHYFENRDMLMSDAMQALTAYEHLVRRFIRSSYP